MQLFRTSKLNIAWIQLLTRWRQQIRTRVPSPSICSCAFQDGPWTSFFVLHLTGQNRLQAELQGFGKTVFFWGTQGVWRKIKTVKERILALEKGSWGFTVEWVAVLVSNESQRHRGHQDQCRNGAQQALSSPLETWVHELSPLTQCWPWMIENYKCSCASRCHFLLRNMSARNVTDLSHIL